MSKLEAPIKQTSSFFKEFKEFAARGNVIDLAVGVIIGAAFGKVVDAVVTNILMPPLGALSGGIDLSKRFITFSTTQYATIEEAKKANAPVITYGVFLDTLISFVLVAFAVFLMVRVINKLHPKPAEAPAKKDCPFCFSSIPIQATRCPNCTSQLEGVK
ncbi:MAG: large conductance mechanosensitive channel protein MscL [Verrucomicrobiota bacterium]|jgi:large conductance mechanosensitive channel